MIEMNEIVAKLKELKGNNLPKMSHVSFFKINGFNYDGISENELKNIDEYLKVFYDYTNTDNNRCLFTDESPSLQWGMAHGSAFDEETGLEWKMYHYLTVNGVEEKFTISLQYHPDCYDI